LRIVKALTFRAKYIIRFFMHYSNYERKNLTLISKIRLENPAILSIINKSMEMKFSTKMVRFTIFYNNKAIILNYDILLKNEIKYRHLNRLITSYINEFNKWCFYILLSVKVEDIL
jgi:hypothetical protein